MDRKYDRQTDWKVHACTEDLMDHRVDLLMKKGKYNRKILGKIGKNDYWHFVKFEMVSILSQNYF